MRKLIATYLALFTAVISWAQVETKVLKQEGLFGEDFHIQYELSSKESYINFSAIETTSIAPLEVLESKMDTVVKNDQIIYTYHLHVTGFDSGIFWIPQFPILAGNQTLLTDSVGISIVPVILEEEPSLKDIAPPVTIPFTLKEFWARFGNTVLIVLGILSIIGLGLWLYFKFRKRKKAEEIVIPPIVTAMEALKTLELNEPVDVFHHKLSEIFKVYLSGIYHSGYEDKTNTEVYRELSKKPYLKEKLVDIKQLLKVNDLAKFAQFIPSEEVQLDGKNLIEETIVTIDKNENIIDEH